eukprot:6178961-Pleurochrysis_carterae.AAC.2
MYIDYLHDVKDNDARITKASDERKALVEKQGMASGTEAAVHTMVEELLELNSKLEGSAHYRSNNLLSIVLLDTLAAHLPHVVCVYKTGKIHQSKRVGTTLTRCALRSPPCSMRMTAWRAKNTILTPSAVP